MKKIILFIFIAINGIAFAQSVPYNVNKKKFPLGDEFEKLLPPRLANWERFAFHDYIPGQENGKVYYKKDRENTQVFIKFGKASSQEDMKTVWLKIYDDATDGKTNEIKQKNVVSISNKYLLMSGKSGYSYTWTRNLYYFILETKNKDVADEFMKLFPY